ncbi:hypothetical protein GCM10010452_44050 [Crossiella cryophila]|uniref:Transposase IS4-like domain-containing protein n=1 Tax=Crossiella cryophila TaxID=43355 RepID=A0A7W7C7A6_9PSEU|nr:hypothetical protein [Crossiella cryophila]
MLSAANTHDSMLFEPLLDTNPTVRGHHGRVRWVVERTISWLLRFKRLGLRYDRTERTTLALLTLACTVINVRRLINQV